MGEIQTADPMKLAFIDIMDKGARRIVPPRGLMYARIRGAMPRLILSFLFVAPHATSVFAMEPSTTINLSFVIRADIISPVPSRDHDSSVSASLSLSGRNDVREHWSSDNNADYFHNSTNLGGEWKVISKDTLEASWAMANFKKYVRVHVSGKNCTVTFKSVLNPGETFYILRRNGITYEFKNQRMVSSTCSIE